MRICRPVGHTAGAVFAERYSKIENLPRLVLLLLRKRSLQCRAGLMKHFNVTMSDRSVALFQQLLALDFLDQDGFKPQSPV